MGAMGWQIKVDADTAVLSELAARVNDFSPAFVNIVGMWIKGNEAKFQKGEGAEASGVSQGGQVFWEPLAETTRAKKRKAGYPDAIMQATGELKAALTHEGGVSQYVDAHRALFGTPLDGEAQAKVGYNWTSRPTVFLNQQDILGIKREIINYINFGENYREFLFARGLDAVRNRKEIAQMDIEFNEALS